MQPAIRPVSIIILSLLSLLSAFLLFQVQPLISKFILPWFGGSPGVWTTCMLFFQVILFLGYAYAHALGALPRKTQFVIHAFLIVAALAVLPISPSESWKPTGEENPSTQILLLLLTSVGLPYFVLSSTSPLVQVWFTRGNSGASPWRLYALSNAGSLVALLSFPFVFEPRWDVTSLIGAWSEIFVAYAALSGLALWMDRQNIPSEPSSPTANDTDDRPPGIWRRFLWVSLPALASVVLLATTNHVCQDVAVIPFLWVVPLSLYLLTFIICFEHERWYGSFPGVWAIPALFILFVTTAYNQLDDQSWWPDDLDLMPNYVFELGWAFSAMFLACMICHGELTRLKPNPRRLTSFYMHMSAGGAFGGLLVSLVAPLVFKTHAEWPIGNITVFVIASIILLRFVWQLQNTARWIALGLTVVAAATTITYAFQYFPVLKTVFGSLNEKSNTLVEGLLLPNIKTPPNVVIEGFGYLAAAAGAFLLVRFVRKTGFRLALISTSLLVGHFALLLLFIVDYSFKVDDRLERVRNFYGTLAVTEWAKDEPEHQRELSNGGIIHGMQNMAPEWRTEPTSYYGHDAGIGRALDSLNHTKGARVGVVGMGAGTVACYGKSGDTYRFYDINPDVPRLAQKYFTYLPDFQARGGKLEIVVSDARLALERDPPQKFDVLLLDAFSGDSVPAHLLTREAFEIYRSHMKPDGIIAVHTTNSYLLLTPLIEKTAAALGYKSTRISREASDDGYQDSTDYVLLTNNEAFLAATPPELPDDETVAQEAEISPRVWTDRHHNLFEILMLDLE